MMPDPFFRVEIVPCGGICFSLRCPDKSFVEELSVQYRNFRPGPRQNQEACYELWLSDRDLQSGDPEDRSARRSGDEPDERGGWLHLDFQDGVYRMDSEEFTGRLDCGCRRAEITTVFEAMHVNTLLRILISLVACRHDSFLVHAAGLNINGRGFLFIGPSSSGKSTTARKADHGEVLNDELVLVERRNGGEFLIHATPFNGDYDAPLASSVAPLAGLLFLSRDRELRLRRMEPIDKLLALMESIFFFDRSPGANRRALSLAGDLAGRFAGYSVNIGKIDNLRSLAHEITSDSGCPAS